MFHYPKNKTWQKLADTLINHEKLLRFHCNMNYMSMYICVSVINYELLSEIEKTMGLELM